MSDLFDENSSVFEQQLKDIFKPTENKEQTSLFSILALVFYHNSKITDLHDVYKLLGLENFIKLISLLDGRNVRFPTSTELKDAIILALCFYYKEIENKDWQEIHELVPYSFNSISISYKIKSLNAAMRQELKTFLQEKSDGNSNRS